jgi:hypothetical protein
MGVSEPLTLPQQLRGMRQSVDPDTGAILFRHATLKGIPDLVVEADGYTMEFIGPTLLCLDIVDPGALGRLLAEPIKQQLPVGIECSLGIGADLVCPIREKCQPEGPFEPPPASSVPLPSTFSRTAPLPQPIGSSWQASSSVGRSAVYAAVDPSICTALASITTPPTPRA